MYVPNNIQFRIISSNVIAQFKHDQAFDLNEVVNSKNFTFSSTSREILLLHYEMWSKFIYKIERTFINSDAEKKIDRDVCGHILSLVDTTESEIEEIIESNSPIFSSSIWDVIKQTNSIFTKFIKDNISLLTGDSIYVGFPKIVKAISNSLHNLLFQLQETDYLFNTDTQRNAFLSYCSECINICRYEHSGICSLVHKAKVYRKVFGVDNFYIKNYTGRDICDNLLEEFENSGLTIKNVVACSAE